MRGEAIDPVHARVFAIHLIQLIETQERLRESRFGLRWSRGFPPFREVGAGLQMRWAERQLRSHGL